MHIIRCASFNRFLDILNKASIKTGLDDKFSDLRAKLVEQAKQALREQGTTNFYWRPAGVADDTAALCNIVELCRQILLSARGPQGKETGCSSKVVSRGASTESISAVADMTAAAACPCGSVTSPAAIASPASSSSHSCAASEPAAQLSSLLTPTRCMPLAATSWSSACDHRPPSALPPQWSPHRVEPTR